jgi:hypothetical protein
MGGHPGQQRTSFFGLEPAGHDRRREQAGKTETSQGHGMPGRDPDGSEHVGNQIIRMINETADVSSIAGAVRAEGDCRLIEASIENPGPASLEGMGDRDLRVDPITDADGSEEGRRNAERVDCGADIVEETRQRELLGAGAAADDVGALGDEDPPTRSCQLDGSGKPVRAGTYNNSIESSHALIIVAAGRAAAEGRRTPDAAAATPQGERRKRIRLRPYVSGPNAARRVGVKHVTRTARSLSVVLPSGRSWEERKAR